MLRDHPQFVLFQQEGCADEIAGRLGKGEITLSARGFATVAGVAAPRPTKAETGAGARKFATVVAARIVAIGVGAVGMMAVMVAAGCGEKTAAVATPPAVTVAKPLAQDVNDYLDFSGNTVAVDSVTLVARVEGFLDKIHFVDGSTVKKGTLLFTIQQAQYQAELQQAIAQVAAQKASLWHARTEFARYTHLLAQDAATQTEVDHWKFETESAEAGLSSAQAQVIIAKLNLSYTEVRAPFDGRIGRHLVNPGNLVGGAGQQTALAQIDEINPLYVYFTINEGDLLNLIARFKTAGAAPQPLSERVVPCYFELSNETGFPHQGRVDFASINVAPTTGTLQLRGIFPNDDGSVFPGLFARVRVPEPQARSALLVPGDAISFDQQGEYLLVVDSKHVVERRSVKAGFQVGSMLVINEGLQPDDWVIVAGLMQAIPGSEVSPQQTTLTPPPDPGSTDSTESKG
jgi:RND family efflux transporter MFP subunit